MGGETQMRRKVVIHWGISSFFGWGVYGLNLALNWAGDPDVEPVCALPVDPSHLAVDGLRYRRLIPFLKASQGLVEQLRQRHAQQAVEIDTPVLAALGNDFGGAPGPQGGPLGGKPTIGVVFFETPQQSAEAIARAKAFPLIITGSTWNEKILREYGVTSVKTIIQGVDQTLFHPAPRMGVMSDRFLVFSGGKLELRKGQDLVIAAFSKFAKSHPEATLVTAWHSPWPKFARTLDESKRASPVVFGDKGQVNVTEWARMNGIAPHQIIDLGAVPNAMMPPILREMDAAVFPNRSEGGTNLVAMECMACGVPTILSANTGHMDLIDDDNCYALTRQAAVAGAGAGVGATPGWGDSSVDEIVETLEKIHADRAEARRRGAKGAAKLADYTWSRTATEMKQTILAL
jgi:glycosyltransferase involved in cell wall biosynthesis